MRGDCLTCVRLGRCAETDVEKVLSAYTCVSFDPVAEAIFLARMEFIRCYGPQLAAQTMLTKPEGERDG